jgi:hypothetical protein
MSFLQPACIETGAFAGPGFADFYLIQCAHAIKAQNLLLKVIPDFATTELHPAFSNDLDMAMQAGRIFGLLI